MWSDPILESAYQAWRCAPRGQKARRWTAYRNVVAKALLKGTGYGPTANV